MDLELAGKVVLVGGGTSGIGAAIADVLLGEGATVAVYGLDDENVPVASAAFRARFGVDVQVIPVDVRSADGCTQAIDEVVKAQGRLDGLVINMSGATGESVLCDDDTWQAEWELWTLAAIRLSRHAVPYLENSKGSIAFVSTCGVHGVIPELARSEVMRLATTGFAKYLAREVADRGIRVNSVLPGWIEGQRMREAVEADARAMGVTAAEVDRRQRAEIPLGIYGTGDDVGHAVAFLASPRAQYITGVNLRVDGGWCQDPTG